MFCNEALQLFYVNFAFMVAVVVAVAAAYTDTVVVVVVVVVADVVALEIDIAILKDMSSYGAYCRLILLQCCFP